jgi:DNA-directed RNA polymerase alpha subunit
MVRIIGLNDRIVECLERSRIYDLGQLTALTKEELLQIKGLGYAHLLSVLRLLRLLNLSLAKK